MSVFPLVRDFIETRDHRLMRHVHQWSAPQWVRLWMICATRGGDGWLWYILITIVALVGGPERYLAIGSAALASGAGIAFFLWAKRVTGRRRPCHIQPHCWSTLLPPDQFSFPSGHTITAFAVLTPMLVLYPEFTFEFSFVALSVAASRIILGMHFLSDVLAGAAAGSLLGYAALALLR
jgi:undecaprenyl-diphosphatase